MCLVVLQVISQSVSLVVIDSIAALARKEALNETERDTFILQQVRGASLNE